MSNPGIDTCWKYGPKLAAYQACRTRTVPGTPSVQNVYCTQFMPHDTLSGSLAPALGVSRPKARPVCKFAPGKLCFYLSVARLPGQIGTSI